MALNPFDKLLRTEYIDFGYCFLIVINECDNQTCFNNGTCVDLDGLSTWRCDCMMGYTGSHCETGTILNILSLNVTEMLLP